MTAPERIWAYSDGLWIEAWDAPPSGAEYIRADLHDATKAQLRKAVEALRWQADQPEAHPFMVLNARAVLAEIEKGGV